MISTSQVSEISGRTGRAKYLIMGECSQSICDPMKQYYGMIYLIVKSLMIDCAQYCGDIARSFEFESHKKLYLLEPEFVYSRTTRYIHKVCYI